MKVSRLFASVLTAASSSLAIPAPDSAASAPVIAFSAKFGAVDFLFTDAVRRKAEADGSNFQAAIREVGFELISALGAAAKSSPGMQAILIDEIKYKDKKAFVVLGIVVDGKFQSLNGPSPHRTVANFLAALEKNRIAVLHTAETAGVELSVMEGEVAAAG